MFFKASRQVALRRRLLTATIFGVSFATLGTVPSFAQSSSNDKIDEVVIVQKRLLIKDADIASAASSVSKSDIEAQGTTTGSLETLLTQTPSVTAYSQGFGSNSPTLAIRGERELEIAQTINGLPLNGFLSGAGQYGTFGAPLTLNETRAADVYPGVAPPDKQGFGTVGGTLAYSAKEATDKRYVDLNVGVGSFGTEHYGFEANSGKLFSDGPDATKALLFYDASTTDGFVKYNGSRYKNVLFNVIQPYNDGLSKVELTVIDNANTGYQQQGPTPLALIQQNGYTYNFPYDQGFQEDSNNYLTAILRDETVITDDFIFDGSLLFQNTTSRNVGYTSPASLSPSSLYIPNFQVPYFFQGQLDPHTGFSYSPVNTFGSYVNGEDAEIVTGHTQTIAFKPSLSYFSDLPWAHQEITVGGLVGRTYNTTATYGYGSTQMPEQWGYNAIAFGGFNQRSVINGFIADKIDLFDDTLHLNPGYRVETAYTSVHNVMTNAVYNPYKLSNYTKQGEPYFGISYDLPEHVTAYASAGVGSLFAPTSDYYVGSSGTTGTPNPEKVYSVEAGLRYATDKLYLDGGWYYQNVKGAFSFFEDYVINQFVAGNTAEQQFRGLEFAAKYKLTPEFSISGNGSYNQAKYLANSFTNVTITEDQYGYEFKGANTSNVPNKLFNVATEYDDGALFARLAAQYTGSSYLTGDLLGQTYCGNPSLAGFNAGTYNPGNYQLCGATTTIPQKNPAHTLFNLLLSYTLPVETSGLQSIKASLNIQNILDKHYYNYAYSSENSLGGLYGILPAFGSGLIGPPRTIMGDITVRF